MHPLANALTQGAANLGLNLTSNQCDQLLAYLDLLCKWNRAYNLTAVRDPREMVSRHLLDSLSLVPWLQPVGHWLDVGSGAGLPGIPLAILAPEQAFTLLDANGKKTRFLTQVKMELGLHNVQVVNARVEDYQTEQMFTRIVSRAYSALTDFVVGTAHLAASDAHWLAMKGAYPEAEVKALDTGFELISAPVLHVPGNTGERHLLIVRRSL